MPLASPPRALRSRARSHDDEARPSRLGHTGAMADGGPRVFAKYALLQLPGWFGVGALLSAAVYWWELPEWMALLIFALWVAKDFAMYPVLRVAYADGSPDGTGSLVGAQGTAVEPLDPGGYVRVGSELWRAEVPRDRAPVARGARVRVRAVDKLTLKVEPE